MTFTRQTTALLASFLLAFPAMALELETRLGRMTGPSPIQVVSDEAERSTIAGYLRANLGEPYRLGGSGGGAGFDCSGLVMQAYAAAGLVVPRISVEQLQAGEPVALDQLQTGDLLFYRMRANAPERLHVAVYVGEGRAIHASVKYGKVREIDITRSIWAKRLIAARDLL